MNCRHCGSVVTLPFVDLGSAPPSNAYLSADGLRAPETWFPLRVLVCETCWLVQTEDHAGRDQLFTHDYAYFSSTSSSWLAHAERYALAMIADFALGPDRLVVEVASNDGYLLQYFAARGVPVLGVEPTASTAAAARAKGIAVEEVFFGVEEARRLRAGRRPADLIAANNVLAHVPDINDFVGGFCELLAPKGIATFEFPHLAELIANTQFDTIYHEHYSYLSLTAVQRIFAANGLSVFRVERLPTHGGSLRVFAQRADTGTRAVEPSVAAMLADERAAGLDCAATYAGFQAAAERVKDDLLAFLIAARRAGKRVAAYGAAAKGNTLLNFAGVRPDLLAFVVDRAAAKQGRFMPGSRIPILPPEALSERHPDIVLILPWNIADEVVAENVAAVPSAEWWVAVPGLRRVA